MDRLEELRRKDGAARELKKKVFLQSIGQYKILENIRGAVKIISVTKEIKNKYYYFCLSQSFNGEFLYEMYTKDTWDDCGHHEKRVVDLKEIPKKWQNEFRELAAKM